jgi:hypothetical protein
VVCITSLHMEWMNREGCGSGGSSRGMAVIVRTMGFTTLFVAAGNSSGCVASEGDACPLATLIYGCGGRSDAGSWRWLGLGIDMATVQGLDVCVLVELRRGFAYQECTQLVPLDV